MLRSLVSLKSQSIKFYSQHRKGLYAGSFDPPTSGHLDIIARSAAVCDELVVAIAVNPKKNPVFTVEERKVLLDKICKSLNTSSFKVTISSFQGLVADYAKEQNAKFLIRGIRSYK
eukprot:TRINITY_DN6716_c0_g1_i1.p1 TRINITY_DN6716_c0_g1~~TRINITY_DN6716_c0_g1_i1.p1  ORF type:complete len:116 (-),score=17.10 TRINITY_DN6716_c0_g1_i1:355-702(-)